MLLLNQTLDLLLLDFQRLSELFHYTAARTARCCCNSITAAAAAAATTTAIATVAPITAAAVNHILALILFIFHDFSHLLWACRSFGWRRSLCKPFSC
jgi:hypothetical protein